MKKLILIYLLLVNSAYAEDINLLCDVTYKDDNSASQRFKTRVEISAYNNGNIFIIPDSNILNSVSTGKTPTTIDIINYSNSSKWHINKVTGNLASGIADTTIIIDRNAGTISYSQAFKFNGQTLNSSAFGYCEKINPNVKKF